MKIFDHSLSSYLSIILLIVIIAMKGYITDEVENVAYKCYVGEYFTNQYQFPTVLVAPELLIYAASTGTIASGSTTTGLIDTGIIQTGTLQTGLTQ